MTIGALWPTPKVKVEELYDRRVVVYRNTMSLKNRARMRDYIWAIEDYKDHKVIAIATEVSLVAAPLIAVPGANPGVVGRIPPGQLILTNAFPVSLRRLPPELHSCICTSDGEVWSAPGRYPPGGHGIAKHTEDDEPLYLWSDVRKLRERKPQKATTGGAAHKRVAEGLPVTPIRSIIGKGEA